MKKQTCIIGNILLLMMFLLLSMTAKAQSYTSCVGGNPIYLPDPNVPSPYTLMWAQYSYAGSELYVVNNKVTIEKYFVGTIYVECNYKCVRQYTVAGHVYEDHQTNTTYFGIKCDPVYTTGLPDQLTMQVGETKTIDWSYRPAYVSRPNLTWTSSDYSVVDVNSNKLTAKKSGRAVVTVKSNAGPDEYINVTIEGGSDVIYVNSISLNETSVSLTEGSTKQLQATVLPSNATDKSVSWSSSNNSVAEVSSSGLVTAKSTGTATITCKANDGSGKSATCSVTVNSSIIEPTSISLPSSKTVKVGESFTMTYTLTPSNATTTLTWSSDDTSIATVSSSGDVKGIKAGTTKIRVKTSNGKTDYCNVTVENNTVEPTSISLPSSKTVKVGESFTMTYTLTPSNATTTLTWSSDDASIATVSSSGVVKGVKAGTTKIRVKTANGKTDYCNVTVETNSVEPTSISLPSSKTVKVGESFTMTYTLTPSNATTTLTWSSDDTSIATVSSSGVVKGIKAGTTNIRVKTYNGKTDYCNVTVESNKVEPTGISLPASATIKVGEYVRIEAQLIPSNASTSLTWYSDDSSIAKIDHGYSSANVFGQKVGNTKIHVKTSNGKSSSCNIMVIEAQIDTSVKKVANVKAGNGHTLILSDEGKLFACGDNSSGQLGNGSTNSSLYPIEVMEGVSSIAAGCCHSLILKEDGTLWACGTNSSGQLGDGTTTKTATPVRIMDEVASMAAGQLHSLFVKKDKTLWACGDSFRGALGLGYSGNQVFPQKVMDNVAFVSAGGCSTMIVKEDGTLWACGDNWCGNLGDGTSENYRMRPVKIMDDVTMAVTSGNHSLIIKKDKTAWACGQNNNGRLGDGTLQDRTIPVKVMDDVISVAAGSYGSFFLKSDGSLWGCGGVYINSGSDSKKPVKLMDNVSSIETADGNHFFFIIKKDGTLWACGDNYYGQLGNGTTTSPTSPVRSLIYIMGEYPFNISTSSTGYATFHDSNTSFILPNGLSAHVVTGISNGKLIYESIANGSTSGVVPKGVPVMLVSDTKQADTFILMGVVNGTTYTDTNLLQGCDESTTTTGDGYHYKLSYGPMGTKWDDVFGWYWGTQNGAPFQIEGHKAWLVIPKSGTRAAGFTIAGDVLGIESLEELSDQPSDLYFDLQGRRLNQPTKRGVYIKNGTKVIFK